MDFVILSCHVCLSYYKADNTTCDCCTLNLKEGSCLWLKSVETPLQMEVMVLIRQIKRMLNGFGRWVKAGVMTHTTWSSCWLMLITQNRFITPCNRANFIGATNMKSNALWHGTPCYFIPCLISIIDLNTFKHNIFQLWNLDISHFMSLKLILVDVDVKDGICYGDAQLASDSC